MATKELTKETALKYLMDAYGKTASLIRSEGRKYIFATDSDDYFCVELSDSGETVDVSRITIDSDTLTKEETISYRVRVEDLDNKKYLVKNRPIDGIRVSEYYKVPDDFDLLNYSGMFGDCEAIHLDENQLSEDLASACMELLEINPIMIQKNTAHLDGNGFSIELGDKHFVSIRLMPSNDELLPCISVVVYRNCGLLKEHTIMLNKGKNTSTLQTTTIKGYDYNLPTKIFDFLSRGFKIDYAKATEEGVINATKTIDGVKRIEAYNSSESSESEKAVKYKLAENQLSKDIASAYIELLGINLGQEPSWTSDDSGNRFIVTNDGNTITITLTLDSQMHPYIWVVELDNNKTNEYHVFAKYDEAGQLKLSVTAILTQHHELKDSSNSLIGAIKEISIGKKEPPQLVRGGSN